MPLLTTNVPKSPYELIRPGNIATITQSGTIAEYAFDASGNVIGLVGPSGTIPLVPRRPKLIALGDSIALITDSVTTQDNYARSFILQGNIQDGSRFDLINAGVSGDTTTQMLARFATDVMGKDADGVIFYGGTNDLPGTIALATTLANIGSMVAQTLAIGRIWIHCTIAPTLVNDDVTVAGTARRLNQGYVNDWARRMARAHQGFYLVDTESVMTDQATGICRTTFVQGDGIHPSYVGGMQMGRPLATVLSNLFQDVDSSVWNYYDPLNLVGSPIALANGNNADGTAGFKLVAGVTGQGPNGWGTVRRVTGTGVSSQVSRAAGAVNGFFGRMAVTATAAWDGAGFVIGGDNATGLGRWDVAWAATTAYTYNIKRRPVAGDNGYIAVCVIPGTSGGGEPAWPTTEGTLTVDGTVTWMTVRRPRLNEQVYAECEIATSALSGNGCVRLTCEFWDTVAAQTVSYNANWDLSGSYSGPPDYLPATMRLRTPLITIPSNSIRYLYASIVGYGAAGSTFNLDVTRVKIYNATQQQATV